MTTQQQLQIKQPEKNNKLHKKPNLNIDLSFDIQSNSPNTYNNISQNNYNNNGNYPAFKLDSSMSKLKDQSLINNIPHIQPHMTPQELSMENMSNSGDENQKLNLKTLLTRVQIKIWMKKVLNRTRSHMIKKITPYQLKFFTIEKLSLNKKYFHENKIHRESYVENQKALYTGHNLLQPSSEQQNRLLWQASTLTETDQNKQSFFLGMLKQFKASVENFYIWFKKQVERIPVIKPQHIGYLMWKFLISCLIIYVFFAIPLDLVYESNQPRDYPFSSKDLLIPAILFLVDIVVSLMTEILPTITLFIYTIKKINEAPNSHHQEFQSLDEGLERYVQLIFLFQINHLSRIVNEFEDLFNFSSNIRNSLTLIKLLATIFLILHLFACIWLLVGYHQISQGTDCWMDTIQITQQVWYEQYFYAYYFVTVTMVTVGYGDVVPVNLTERILCIFTQLISCGVFAYCIQTVGQTIEEFYKISKERKRKLYIIKNYMSQKNINQDLQYQIRQYLNYYYEEIDEDQLIEQEKIINQLSDDLKQTLSIEANKIVLKDSFIFKNFSDLVIQKTVSLIKEYRCTPEDIIYLEGEMNDCSLYFIEKGAVEIYFEGEVQTNENKVHIQTLTKGHCFGQDSFFTGECQRTCVKSIDFCTLLKINRQDFINLLCQHQPDYERFCFIKDYIRFLSNYEKLEMQCSSCGSGKHIISDCPYLHLTLDKHNVIKKATKILYQDRKTYTREDNYSFHALADFSTINQDQFELIEEEAGYIEEYYENFHSLQEVFFEPQMTELSMLQNQFDLPTQQQQQFKNHQRQYSVNSQHRNSHLAVGSQLNAYQISQQMSCSIVPELMQTPSQRSILKRSTNQSQTTQLKAQSSFTSEEETTNMYPRQHRHSTHRQSQNNLFFSNNGNPNLSSPVRQSQYFTPQIAAQNTAGTPVQQQQQQQQEKNADPIIQCLLPQTKRRMSTKIPSFIGNRLKLNRKKTRMNIARQQSEENQSNKINFTRNLRNELISTIQDEMKNIKVQLANTCSQQQAAPIYQRQQTMLPQLHNNPNHSQIDFINQYTLQDGEVIDFESMKQFESYFPWNNADFILDVIKYKLTKKEVNNFKKQIMEIEASNIRQKKNEQNQPKKLQHKKSLAQLQVQMLLQQYNNKDDETEQENELEEEHLKSDMIASRRTSNNNNISTNLNNNNEQSSIILQKKKPILQKQKSMKHKSNFKRSQTLNNRQLAQEQQQQLKQQKSSLLEISQDRSEQPDDSYNQEENLKESTVIQATHQIKKPVYQTQRDEYFTKTPYIYNDQEYYMQEFSSVDKQYLEEITNDRLNQPHKFSENVL